jgi:hypothetical protein
VSQKEGRCSYVGYEFATTEASMEERRDRFTAIEDQYADYTVYTTPTATRSARSTTSSSTRTTNPSTSG